MMSKTCPSCGYKTDDTQSLYCNKCGFPLPPALPRNQTVTTTPAVRPAPAVKRPAQPKNTGISGFLSFETLITGDSIGLIYILGAVVIVLASLMGIAGMFSLPIPEGTNMSITNTTALAENPAGSPLFWAGFLIAGSILWRMFCELFVVLSRGYGVTGYGREPDSEPADYREDDPTDTASAWTGTKAECPRCHKIVPVEDLRECEHCGVQGCSSCIRMMGLLKKTMTCRECFEAK